MHRSEVTLRRAVQRNARASTSLEGTVIGVGPGVVTVRLANSGRIVRNIPVTGEYPSIGGTVIVEYNTTDKPRARNAQLSLTQVTTVETLPASATSSYAGDDEGTTGSSEVHDAEYIRGAYVNIGVPSVFHDQKAITWDEANQEWRVYYPYAKEISTVFTFEGALEVKSNPLRIYNRYTMNREITEVFINAATAPTGADLIVDVNIDGSTIWPTQSNRVKILDGANTGVYAFGSPPAWDIGSYITVDIDQVGATIPGSDLVIQILTRPNPA